MKKIFNNHIEYYNEKGKTHRDDDLPAVEFANGTKYWCQNGKRHRLDGPAIEYVGGYKEWYYQGEKIQCSSQEEFKQLVKLRAFW